MPAKTEQLQIRISADDKRALIQAARKASLGMSEYVLSRVLPAPRREFKNLLQELRHNHEEPSFALAELGVFLGRLSAMEFAVATAEWPVIRLSDYLMNYVAAMVELAAQQGGISPPPWTVEIEPLAEPAFGCDLENLQLHLLTHSPIPFRRRNIFIDSSLGDHV